MSRQPTHPYVGKGGLKLAFALDAFGIHPEGLVAADLGAHIGGFTDCLLQRGAAKVYAVDTCYGTLAWKLRNDPRVVVMERTNALHASLPEPADLVTIDVGWTRQQFILPRAIELAAPGARIISLVKPQYEADRGEVRKGRLSETAARETTRRVTNALLDDGLPLLAAARSPIRGGKGNVEYFLLLRKPAT